MGWLVSWSWKGLTGWFICDLSGREGFLGGVKAEMEGDGNGRFKLFLLSMKLGETQFSLFPPQKRCMRY